MRYFCRHAARFGRDQGGAVAVTMALMAPVLIGLAALAVDISLYRFMHNKLQTAADAAALAAAQRLHSPADATDDAIDYASRNVPAAYGAVTTADDVAFGWWEPATRTFAPASGTGVNAVRVTAERSADHGNAPQRFLGRIFGPGAATISASAVAVRQVWLQYEPPVSISLNNEAGDFNEMYAYCFDNQSDGPPGSRRSQMTLIANNMPAGSNLSSITGGVITQTPQSGWPECRPGESLSFRLRNIRHAKAQPQLWANPNQPPYRPEHNHYTDTMIEGGVEHFNLEHDILETVRCDTQEECDPDDPDNILPSGDSREPEVETRPCMPGKFMYLAWEDRPYKGQAPGTGSWTDPNWTDLDFDDIRIVMECPETGMLGDGRSRLVR
jgi:hypothetical protein